MKIKIIPFLLIILALVSCSKKSSQTYKPLFFHVDSLLLEPAYIDSSMNFAFQAPKGWKTVSADMFEKIRNKEKQNIMDALMKTNGNISKAAQILNLSRRKIQYRIKKYGLK